MREGWVYKKLGEVCEIRGGATPLRTNDAFWTNGNIPWFTIDDIREQGKYITFTNQKITDAAKEKLYTFPKGTIMLCCTASLGACSIAKIELTSNQQFNGLMIKNREELLEEYLYYFATTLTPILLSLSGKATINFVSRAKVEKIDIPIPPLTTQQQIVSELDLLSHILDQKRQQLKEYDALAESIFYDMFGDPVDNPKGWEICSLDSITDVRDGTHDSPKYLEHSDYILITSKNIVNGEISFENINYISEEDYNNINKRSFVETGDIIMAMIGTIGNPIIVKRDRNFCVKNVAIIKFCDATKVINIYIKALLDNASYFKYLTSLNKGGTQKFVALGTLRKLPIPLPPLDLQRSFAAKIESIEHQKQLLRASIKETEMLFQSRMDYWFNG